MAGYMKKVFIIGNLGRDPEVREAPTADRPLVANFNVAVNDRARRGQGADAGSSGQGGQPEETTTWFRVTAWRRQAEIVRDYLKKGMSVFVSGDLTVREYFSNDGEKRTSLDIAMQDMQILTPRGGQEFGGDAAFDAPATGGNPAYGRSRPTGVPGGSSSQRPAPPMDSSPDEEDIPF